MKKLIKKLIPEKLLKWLRPYYHGALALDANIFYERPSEKMIVVGITGTAGKSTTTHMLAHILNKAGIKAGYITTVDFFDGQDAYINKHGLSMPGEFLLQRQLRAQAARKCKVAIIECTSEGLAQNRHLGINFDVALFTNLSPAHLDSHGGFEPYRAAKFKLFQALAVHHHKFFFPNKIKGVNLDDPEAVNFLQFKADRAFGVTFGTGETTGLDKIFRVRETVTDSGTCVYEMQGKHLLMNLPGKFNIQNAFLAVACANMLGVAVEAAVESLSDFSAVAGRMEEIKNSRGFKIFVDYAPEPAGMKNALEALQKMPHNRIIHVFGSTGGHRDIAKRFEFGKISAGLVDHLIITNDDVYDSDPQEIAKGVESGIKSQESRKLQYEVILDRREAIRHALSIAQQNDIVIVTGKGSEQFLVLPRNKRIEWDDREVVREELHKLTPTASS